MIKLIDLNEEEVLIFKQLFCLLHFTGSRGLPLDKFMKKMDIDDLDKIINSLREFLGYFDLNLIINENILFLKPNFELLQVIYESELDSFIPSVSVPLRRILLYFLVSYLSQGQIQPISKERFKHDFKLTFDMRISESQLDQLKKNGFIELIRDKFIDIGWRLQGRPELRKFSEMLKELIDTKRISLSGDL